MTQPPPGWGAPRPVPGAQPMPPATPGQGWGPQQPVGTYAHQPLPAVTGVLPERPVEYHQLWRSPRWRWWRGLLAALMFVGIALAGVLALGVVQVVIQTALGEPISTNPDELTVTPTVFLVNNAAIACFIPAAMLAAWACVGQRPRWLSSVTGRLRWRWLGVCLLVCLPLWGVLTAIELVGGGFDGWSIRPTTWLMLGGILLTTPLQCAGEEYANRGFIPRLFGAWIPHRTAGLVVGTVVSALVFMALHAAADPWLNVFYFAFGALASVIAWRTGGLEATIAIHVVNNLSSEISLPFTDISGVFNREVGTADWSVVLPLLAVVLAGVAIEVAARRLKIERVGPPAGTLVHPAVAPPAAWVPPVSQTTTHSPWQGPAG